MDWDGEGEVEETRPRYRPREQVAHRRLANRATPGLPVDGDPMELRNPVETVGGVVNGVFAGLMAERSPFFDLVCRKWPDLFPGLPARPGRWDGGRLFLHVGTSGKLFALRPKLAQIRRVLETLPGAPKKFSLHLEIRAPR